MNEQAAPDRDLLSLSAEERVDEVCCRFERARQAGQHVKIEEYLGPIEAERSALLRELLRLDVEYRRRDDEEPTVDEYRSRFRADASAIATWYPSEPIGCNTPAEATSRLPSLPGYEINDVLGRGAFGIVYKAIDPLKRHVALKMLKNYHATPVDLRKEAETLAQLHHPHIVQIFQVGDLDGDTFMALEYVDGGNLAAKLKKGWRPSDMEAADLVQVLAGAVQHAHDHYIVHRDLKPANILLSDSEVPKIADFGLAKILSEDSGATRTGAIIGTPSYMSPEQAAGKVGEIGPTTDVYALGATLYELLTGRPPFRGETVQEILDLVKNEAPEPPHAYKPRVDRSLEAICMQCLKKTAQDRYASAQALAEDLERFRDGEPVHAQNGAVRGAIGAIMRECRHAEFIRLWGPGLMANGIGFFLFCVAWYLLVANRVEQFAPYYAILVAKAVFDYGLLVWWFRLKNGPPFRHFERQILRVLSFFWILVFLTVWQYQLAGGPVAGLLPILVLELAFSFTCAAIILGGSFYTTAAAFFGAAVLQSLWPEYGTLILATTALVLFWVGWKYARRAPPA